MLRKKIEHPKEKTRLHPRNRHRERYDFEKLICACPELSPFVRPNLYGDESIDFFDPEAVKTLNKALLKLYYDIEYWDIPKNYLCPPIPGRADYIHLIADMLADSDDGKIPAGPAIRCLDVGVGANCVYPIIGNKEYGWSFVGTDIDPLAIESAGRIIELNSALKGKVELRLQSNPKDIFNGIMQKGERFDVSVCNPPFHASLAEARAGTIRKLSNLTQKKVTRPTLNFGGQSNELWSEGGEERFVGNMVAQSRIFASSCFCFSTLISKESNLMGIYQALRKAEAFDVKTLAMGQGQKTGRIVAWTFLDREQQKQWMDTRWLD
jgi:23S rRNA (adenine1618-N6)-methyltransferase